jgi:hypothetical protein
VWRALAHAGRYEQGKSVPTGPQPGQPNSTAHKACLHLLWEIGNGPMLGSNFDKGGCPWWISRAGFDFSRMWMWLWWLQGFGTNIRCTSCGKASGTICTFTSRGFDGWCGIVGDPRGTAKARNGPFEGAIRTDPRGDTSRMLQGSIGSIAPVVETFDNLAQPLSPTPETPRLISVIPLPV